MAIHPFQIGDLNGNFLQTAPASRVGASYASEFGVVSDNINGGTSRYFKLLSTWANIAVGANSTPTADATGQGTGSSDQPNNGSNPWRPNGSYFVRSMNFCNTAVPPAAGGFRDGYIGSFVGGLISGDYSHDTNGSTVDYEPIYSHGAASWPMTADIAHQWLDSTSNPSDGTDAIVNSSSAFTRNIYMPPVYHIMHIASAGSNTLGSGNVKFSFEERPTLRMAGFNDLNGVSQVVNSWAGSCIPGNGSGKPGPYSSDPIRGGGSLNTSASDNYHELYQVTGARKLNSRGLSFHTAKVFDNGYNAFAYPFEEDGITLGTGVTISGGTTINNPGLTQVNNQSQYIWAGGRDKGASVVSTSVTTNVVTFTTANAHNFAPGQIVIIQGLTNHFELNGALLTLSTASGTTFTAAWTNGNYGTAAETQGTATFNPDFRVHQPATFIINEEYYGLVMDTKCSIWSNKTSMTPLVFFDLADIWTGSTAKRIAGVAVVPTYINATHTLSWQIFFLSEDGKLARYDFTQTNGVLELAGSGSFSFASNAPAVAAVGEAYGAFRARSTTSTITNISLTTNVISVTASNTFHIGEVVNLQGLTTATFLNNQTVTVASIIGGGTGFTAAYTHANYGSAADTGTAVGYDLWALYGTMTGDPRRTQAGLVNTANINLFRYLIGTGAWSGTAASPNTGRHNGRSLNEFIVARDGKMYILCENVTVTGGGPFSVSNAFGGVTNVNWQLQAYDPILNTWNASKLTGPTIQYGTNMGAVGTSPNQDLDFWFYNINAFVHDIALNKILIQGNWTTGALWTLDVSGTTAALTNANLSFVSSGTVLPNDAFIPSQTDPSIHPVSITHARDFATNGERTIFFPHKTIRSNPTTMPVYLAPPSYNWGSPSALTLIQRNTYASNPPAISSFDQDKWSYSDLSILFGNSTDHGSFLYPTVLIDNYIHFLRPGGGQADGIPSNATYGRAVGQTTAYLPTYWKWTGSWVMADSWTDSFTNPQTVSAANVDVTLPYGLKVQFGPASGTSYTLNEFHTFNMCYGNTKFARKVRSSWAMFAGQTFTNADTRTLATQNALSLNFIDTDLGTVTLTAPTSVTPHTATLTPNSLGWNTQVTWPKLDPSNVGHDATPLVMVWAAAAFNPATFAYSPAINPTGSNPYSWTVGATTYVVTSSAEQVTHEAWRAFSGSPTQYWNANAGPTQSLKIDLASATTVRSYGFRPVFATVGTDTLDGGVPRTWTLEGSATGAFLGEQVIVDTQTNITSFKRGAAFNVGSPAAFRYYRMNITATQSGTSPNLSMFRLNTAVLTSTVSFSDLAFYAYGSQGTSSTYFYPFIRNWQMARGIKFEVSTNSGGSYSIITPLWRAHNGYVWSFARQTGITNIRLTVQHGFNFNTSINSGNVSATTAFGPFYLFDYGVNQAALDNARLGSSGAPVGTAAAGSFDPNCLGIATDVPNISIDAGNPGLLTPYSVLENGAVHGFWDFLPVPSAQYKLHPFYGFILFQNAGIDGRPSDQTGTNAVINYQWGRRI